MRVFFFDVHLLYRYLYAHVYYDIFMAHSTVAILAHGTTFVKQLIVDSFFANIPKLRLVSIEKPTNTQTLPPNLFFYPVDHFGLQLSQEVKNERVLDWLKEKGWRTAKSYKLDLHAKQLWRIHSSSDFFLLLILQLHLSGQGLPSQVFCNIAEFLNLSKIAREDNPFLTIYPIRYVKALICCQDEAEMANSMREILGRLQRDGFELASHYRYTGTNPGDIRKEFLASTEPEQLILVLDGFCYSVVSNLFGTKIATKGFDAKKVTKYKRNAINLVACAKEAWAHLEENKPEGLNLSKNAVPAALPEAAVVCASLDPNGLMPSLLQLALEPETKSTIRKEMEESIGQFNNNVEASETAAEAQNRSKLGTKGQALVGKSAFKKTLEGFGDLWIGGKAAMVVSENSMLSTMVEHFAQNPNLVLYKMEEGRKVYIQYMAEIMGFELGE